MRKRGKRFQGLNGYVRRGSLVCIDFVQKKMGEREKRGCERAGALCEREGCVKSTPLSNGSGRACRDQQRGYQGNRIGQR